MSRHKTERGQTLVLLALTFAVMLGVLGLAVDIGWAYFRKQAARAAAESAAIAAVAAAQSAAQTAGSGLTCATTGVVCQAATACPNPIPSPPTNNIHSACLYAKDNGYAVTSGGRQNVTIQANTTSPAPTVSGLNVAYWVTVVVSENLPQGFSAVLGNRMATVAVRATAAVLPGNSGGGGCVYVMNPTSTAISMSGTATVQTGCGIYVNSNNNAAVLMSGSPQIIATGGSSVNIVGNWLKSGSASISPAPKLGGAVVPDPFAAMQPPVVGSCTSTGVNLSGFGTQTLNPGVYCGAINISGGVAVTMNPGLYILKSGINMSGTTSISGSGVTIYAPSGGIAMSGTGGINLSAPTAGDWQGILIYQDRNNSSSSALSGGSTELLNGVVYMPKAALTYSGGSGTSATNTTLVVDSVTFSGNSYIKDAAPNSYTGGGAGGIALVE